MNLNDAAGSPDPTAALAPTASSETPVEVAESIELPESSEPADIALASVVVADPPLPPAVDAHAETPVEIAESIELPESSEPADIALASVVADAPAAPQDEAQAAPAAVAVMAAPPAEFVPPGESAAAPAAPVAPASPAPAASPAPKPPRPPRVPDPQMEERRLYAQQSWERVVAAREKNETVMGVVTATVNGGVLVDVGGIRGFLPASQTQIAIGTPLDTLVKTTVPLKVIDIDQNRRRIVVSQRRALEENRRAKRSDLLRSLKLGDRHEGTVLRLTDFGAFVDIGGVDGLIPMSELAFERVDKASDVLTIGEKVAVTVLRIDEGGKKIALSRKNALPDPWRDHAAVLRTGNTVEGTVVAKEPRLMVEIAPGVVGSVRDSDADPADYVIGEKIEVAVRSVDRRTRRINLTTMYGAAAIPQASSGFAPLGIELKRS